MLIVLSGCSKHEPGAWRNDGIDASVREDFSELNKVLFEGLKANNPKLIEKIMSKTMLEDVNKVRLIELCSIRMRKGKTIPLDEYYMVHDFNKDNTMKADHGINSYTLTYQPTTREMYVAFYMVNEGAEQWLLSAIYNKLNYGWKLCELELNPLTIDGKSAPQLYQQAQKQYESSYISNAMSSMEQARNCSTPNVMWRYALQSEMDKFYTQLSDEVGSRYKFPLAMNQVPTHPVIFMVVNKDTDEGRFPLVMYLSKIRLKDTVMLKQEHEAVRKSIGKIIPGIDKEKKFLMYAVFNELPNWQLNKTKKVDHYDFKDILER
ncbi:hypothetical protein ACFQ3S_09350 [Mucilaginibacter terrae]|uniref:hypothetical protein n=1 Tax=Mucilaginibacter terrae TaxID=1955052 RepID=UPI00362DE8DE